MQRDLGSRDVEFMDTVKYIRTKILDVAGISKEDFTMVPLQGSGTFSVEAAIMTMVPKGKFSFHCELPYSYKFSRLLIFEHFFMIPISKFSRGYIFAHRLTARKFFCLEGIL